MRDSGLMACTDLLLGPGDPVIAMSAAASSAAVAAALSVDLAAAVAGSVSSVPTAANQEAGVMEPSGESGEAGRHMPHHWMRADVAATIRTIHNNKKATIRQHYYPEGMMGAEM